MKNIADNKIRFRELPFQPDRNQVFYIENGYDIKANDFIRGNYADLKSMFRRIGMDFYYLPYLMEEHDIEAQIRYYAPYLSPKLLVQRVKSNAFVQFLPDDAKEYLRPSFLFEGRKEECYEGVCFLFLLLSDIDIDSDNAIAKLERLILETKESCSIRKYENHLQWQSLEKRKYIQRNFEEHEACDISLSCPSTAPESSPQTPVISSRRKAELSVCQESQYSEKGADSPLCLFNRFGMKSIARYKDGENERTLTEEELVEEQSIIETAKVLHELRTIVQRLRLEGVSLMAIHEFIDKQEPLSHMTITLDYRIFLPDYNNLEIEMGALPKAIYFLFLRYPEGIIYKHMPDYNSELLNIYRQLRPNTDEARLNLTITKVVNPLGNALNENLARIRKAFVEKFDEHLASNYIITGERGSLYSIPINRELITWEE